MLEDSLRVLDQGSHSSHCILPGCLWADPLTSRNFGFLICQMQTAMLTSQGCTGRSKNYILKQMVQGCGRPENTSRTLAMVITVCLQG